VLLAGVSFAVLVTASAQTREETKEAKIKRAMTGVPLAIAKNAKIVEFSANGTTTTLREGSNGWTCFPGSAGEAGNDMCLDEPAMQWLTDLIGHKPKPTKYKAGYALHVDLGEPARAPPIPVFDGRAR